MKTPLISLLLLLMSVLFTGCSGKPASVGDEGSYVDPRSLTHISEAGKLRIGMHESEVIKILGPPASKEEGFYSGARLWFKLYNPKYETIPTHFLVSIDRHGYVTFISNGG